MVSILHISDLHFTRDAAMHNMRQILLDEAREKVHDTPRDEKLLVVTGDFHNYWAKDYQDAIKFLDELIVAMDIDPKEDVFIVPGNHDVGNDTALGALLESEDPNWKKHNKAAVVMLQNGDMDYVDERLRAFRQYSGFAIELGVYDSKQGIDYPSQVHIRRWRDKLNILHLNTALIADGKAKDNQVADITTATDLELWRKWYRDDLPALALGHNSFYDMAEEQQHALETMFAQKNISAYLCGDTHLRNLSPNKARIPIKDGELPIPNVVCAKSVADMSDNYSDFGYYWHEWDEKTDNVTAIFYRWQPEYLSETAAEGIPIKYKMRCKKPIHYKTFSEDQSKNTIGINRPCRVFLCYRGNTAAIANMFRQTMVQDPDQTYGNIWYSDIEGFGNFIRDIPSLIHETEWVIFFVGETFTRGFLDAEEKTNTECITAKELVAIEKERQFRENNGKTLKMLSINIDGGKFDSICANDLRQLFKNEGILTDNSVESYVGLNLIPFNSRNDHYRKFIEERIAPYCALLPRHTMKTRKTRQFKLGISYAGEQREFVRQVYTCLCNSGIFDKDELFFDDWQEHLINGANADIVLDKIYSERCEKVVVLFSEAYLSKHWTNKLEWRRAITNLITDDTNNVCLLRFRDVDIDSIDLFHSGKDIVKDVSNMKPEDVAKFIINWSQRPEL